MIKRILLISFSLLITACNQPDMKLAIVQEDDKSGVINGEGKVVVKAMHTHIESFYGTGKNYNHQNFVNLHWIHTKDSQPYATVENTAGKFGIIDQNGRYLLKPIYDSIHPFFNGFARVSIAGKFGLINKKFEVVLKPSLDYIQDFVGDIAIVHNNNKYGCINTQIKYKVKPSYSRIYFQQENFLRTFIDGKWGYLDNQCNVLAKPVYSYGYDFVNGYAKVILNGNVGYLNSKGELITKNDFTKQSDSF